MNAKRKPANSDIYATLSDTLDADPFAHVNSKPETTGGEPPHNGDMETRVARLEDFAEKTGERLGRVEEKLVRVETKLDHIEKEVSNFKWWVVAQIVAALLTVVGTGVAIQQMTVATFQAAGQQVPAPQQPPIIINVPGAAPVQAPAK